MKRIKKRVSWTPRPTPRLEDSRKPQGNGQNEEERKTCGRWKLEELPPTANGVADADVKEPKENEGNGACRELEVERGGPEGMLDSIVSRWLLLLVVGG